jgi:hypothetical protein
MAHVSTSYSERANLTMRMSNRRFTRLTNAFSKKFENNAHMVAIYAVWYNWLRIHKTLRVTPAMAAGLSKTVMDWSDVGYCGSDGRGRPSQEARALQQKCLSRAALGNGKQAEKLMRSIKACGFRENFKFVISFSTHEISSRTP